MATAERRRAALALACAGCLAFLLASPASSRAEAMPHPAARPGSPDCAGLRGGRRLTHENRRWGFVLSYPSVFVLDPDSVPESGASARFWTLDRRATAVVTGLDNPGGQSLAALLREAKQDVVENGRGTITYERATRGWFVLSGHMAGRIYYRRSFLARQGQVIASLWIEFPRDLRPCLEAAVTMMSLSFRPSEP